jgi:ClpP class serine protease
MRPLSADERGVLSRMLHTTYSRFLRRVSEGRNRPVAELTPAAEGRIMSGRRARQLGLVDRPGSLRQAIARARERGRLRHDARVEVWPPQRSMLDSLAEAMGGAPPRRRRSEALLRDLAESAGPIGRAALATPLLFGRERVAVALPYVIEIR